MFLTQGPAVPAFEAALADACQDPMQWPSTVHPLHAACLALDLGPGDRLWTSPISFVASANCGLYCGAHVEADIDPATALIRLSACGNGTLPKVLVPVHLVGTVSRWRSWLHWLIATAFASSRTLAMQSVRATKEARW